MNKHHVRSIVQELIRVIPFDSRPIDDVAIAGGAIRDYILNREIKDIDIFTTPTDWAAMKDTFEKNYDIAYLKGGFFYKNPAYECAVAKTQIQGQPVDIIVIKNISVQEAIKRFPIGLSQVGLHLKHRNVGYSKLAKTDYSNNTITINPDIDYDNEPDIQDYVQRIARYYPSRTILRKT